jgi:hypothetical protein
MDTTRGHDDSSSSGDDGIRLEGVVPCSLTTSSSSNETASGGGLYATADGGYTRLSSSLRSVLFHPTALPLVRFFNHDENDKNDDADDAETAAHIVYSKDCFARFPSECSVGGGGGSSTRFDKVLQEGYAAYQSEEHEPGKRTEQKDRPSDEALADILREGISRELPCTLHARRGHRLRSSPGSASDDARTGLLIRRHDDHDHRGIVLLMEVGWGGADTELWWKMADQNAQYLELFQYPVNRSSEATFSGPLLLAVLTMDQEKAMLDDPSRESAKLGVFLCAPRPPLPAVEADEDGPLPGYRAALLWRDTFTTLSGASMGMGKTLRATVALAQMLTDPGRRAFSGFASLGPNCCRIGNKVSVIPSISRFLAALG